MNLIKNKLTKIDSVTVNRKPSSDNELANKKYVDDSIGQGSSQIHSNVRKLSQSIC